MDDAIGFIRRWVETELMDDAPPMSPDEEHVQDAIERCLADAKNFGIEQSAFDLAVTENWGSKADFENFVKKRMTEAGMEAASQQALEDD